MNEKSTKKSIIRPDTFAQGTLKSKGDLYISGTVRGSIITEGTVEVTQQGRVEGEIESGTAYIEGKVSGTLEARQYIHINASSIIEAYVIAPRVKIEEGALISGSFAITPDSQERQDIKSNLSQAKNQSNPYQKVHFSTTHLEASEIKLIGTFNDWDESKAIEMQPNEEGQWSVDIKLKPGRYEYLYLIDGTPHTDRDNPETVTNNYGGENSLLVVD